MTLLIEIILFYILHVVSAPAWCYVLNSIAVLMSIFKAAVSIGQGLHELNPDDMCIESESEEDEV